VKCHGGKYYLCRRIIKLFPDQRVYVEPFCGGMSCLLNKSRTELEVAGDLDAELIDFYKVLIDRTDELIDRLPDPLPTRTAFETAFAGTFQPSTDPVDRAVKFLVRNRWSRGGLGSVLCWADRLRGKRHRDGAVWDLCSAWRTIREQVPALADRLREVRFRHAPALDLIREFDAPDSLHYCDPPYLPETRSVLGTYRFEMSESDHHELLAALRACRGAVIVSGYPSRVYSEALVGWMQIGWDMPNHASQSRTKTRRQECVWISPAASSRVGRVWRQEFLPGWEETATVP
jgi:DNA adenine methylase